MHHVTRRLAITACAGVLALGASAHARADDVHGKEAAAEAAAGKWLALVDDGHYAESWDAAAELFRNAVPRGEWIKQVSAVRRPFGKVEKRELESRKYATALPGAPDGQYVVIQYRTSFSHKKSSIETITPMLDRDGTWRVSGYFVR